MNNQRQPKGFVMDIITQLKVKGLYNHLNKQAQDEQATILLRALSCYLINKGQYVLLDMLDNMDIVDIFNEQDAWQQASIKYWQEKAPVAKAPVANKTKARKTK